MKEGRVSFWGTNNSSRAYDHSILCDACAMVTSPMIKTNFKNNVRTGVAKNLYLLNFCQKKF